VRQNDGRRVDIDDVDYLVRLHKHAKPYIRMKSITGYSDTLERILSYSTKDVTSSKPEYTRTSTLTEKQSASPSHSSATHRCGTHPSL